MSADQRSAAVPTGSPRAGLRLGSSRLAVILGVLVSGLAAYWFVMHRTPEIRERPLVRLEELAGSPRGTKAACCELSGANKRLGGRGDWEAGVAWPAAEWKKNPPSKPPCPCGCPEGAGCPDVLPWQTAESDAASRLMGLPLLKGEGTAFCCGVGRGVCSHSPAQSPLDLRGVPAAQVETPKAAGCVKLDYVLKASDGAVLKICDWSGLNVRFGGKGDWEVAVCFDDPEGERWKRGERPACPCGCPAGKSCGALNNGYGLAVFCDGATQKKCPNASPTAR